MATRIMMALGSYRFSMDTAAYQDFRRQTSFRWTEQDRVGRAPALQFLGPGKETLELSGTIYPHYKGGLGQLDAMRAEAGKGEPLILVDGQGRVWGKWVIEEVAETQDAFLPGGVPRKQTFHLKLGSYGEDA